MKLEFELAPLQIITTTFTTGGVQISAMKPTLLLDSAQLYDVVRYCHSDELNSSLVPYGGQDHRIAGISCQVIDTVSTQRCVVDTRGNYRGMVKIQ